MVQTFHGTSVNYDFGIKFFLHFHLEGKFFWKGSKERKKGEKKDKKEAGTDGRFQKRAIEGKQYAPQFGANKEFQNSQRYKEFKKGIYYYSYAKLIIALSDLRAARRFSFRAS